jgi:hypothetical protein
MVDVLAQFAMELPLQGRLAILRQAEEDALAQASIELAKARKE